MHQLMSLIHPFKQPSLEIHGPAKAPLPKLVHDGRAAQPHRAADHDRMLQACFAQRAEGRDLSPIRLLHRAWEAADVEFSSRANVGNQPVARPLNRQCSL